MRKNTPDPSGILGLTISQLMKADPPEIGNPATVMPDTYGQTNTMKYSNVTDAELNGALAAVIHGHDEVAARSLVEYFHERIHQGEAFNERVLLEYLDHAFGRIVAGKSADVAFGFKRGQGEREREDTTHRDVVAAAYFLLQRRSGQSWEGSIQDAAEKFWPTGKGGSAAKTAVATYVVALQLLPDQVLREMVEGVYDN